MEPVLGVKQTRDRRMSARNFETTAGERLSGPSVHLLSFARPHLSSRSPHLSLSSSSSLFSPHLLFPRSAEARGVLLDVGFDP